MTAKILMFLLLLSPTIYAEEPWGKDSSLTHLQNSHCRKKCNTPLFGTFAETMISFHQDVISPADGPRSHHKPSSSQYALDAMRKYGFFQGFFMGCDRLMRENNDPWIYPIVTDSKGDNFKWDPVR